MLNAQRKRVPGACFAYRRTHDCIRKPALHISNATSIKPPEEDTSSPGLSSELESSKISVFKELTSPRLALTSQGPGVTGERTSSYARTCGTQYALRAFLHIQMPIAKCGTLVSGVGSSEELTRQRDEGLDTGFGVFPPRLRRSDRGAPPCKAPNSPTPPPSADAKTTLHALCWGPFSLVAAAALDSPLIHHQRHLAAYADWGGCCTSSQEGKLLNRMLQEILMALAGYPGDLFVRVDGEAFLRKEEEGHTETEAGSRGPCLWESHGAYGGGFRVNPSLSGFSQSEVEALERVVAPGYDLLLVKDFIKAAENTGTFPPPASTGCPPFNGSLEWHSGSLAAVPASQAAAETSPPVAGGLYLAALARASRELTDEYLSFLIAAEDAALQQQATLLSAISLALGDQPQRMRTLRYILSQVCAMSLAAAGAGGPLPCGALLDMLWRGRSSGDPVAREVYLRLIDACAAVFCFQLSAWLLSGQLLDPYGEFFIVRRAVEYSRGIAPPSPFRTLETTQSAATVLSSTRGLPDAMGAPMEAEDLKEPLSVDALLFEWGRLFQVSVSRLLWGALAEGGHLFHSLKALRDAYLLGDGPSKLSGKPPLTIRATPFTEADLVLRGTARMDRGEILLQHSGGGPHAFSASESCCPIGVAMHPERQMLRHGFKHGFQFRLEAPQEASPLGPPPGGSPVGVGACVALVLQSNRTPISLKGPPPGCANSQGSSNSAQCGGSLCDFFWPSLGEFRISSRTPHPWALLATARQALPPTKDGCVSREGPPAGPRPPPAVLLRRGLVTWSLPSGAPLDAEEIFVEVEYSAEKRRLRVFATRGTQRPQRKQQLLGALRHNAEGAPCLEVSDFDLRNLISLRLGAAYVGLFTLPLKYAHSPVERRDAGAPALSPSHVPPTFEASDWVLSRRRRIVFAQKTFPGASSAPQGDPVNVCRQFWAARGEVAFYISRIYAYFQYYAIMERLGRRSRGPGLRLVCVQPGFDEVEKTANGRHDFEEIRLVHENFLTQLASRCWLRVSSLLRPLMRLLAAGRRLVELGSVATRMPGGLLGGPPADGPSSEEASTGGCSKQHSSEVLIFGILEGPQWSFLAEAIATTRNELRAHASQMYMEMSALKQGASHAHLGALALPLDFNGFLSHLVSGAPCTPRNVSYTGALNTPRSVSAEGRDPAELHECHPVIVPESAGAPTAAAAAVIGPTRPSTLSRTLESKHLRGTPPPHLRRSASVGESLRQRPPSSPPRFWGDDSAEANSDEDGVLLHSCRSTDTDADASRWGASSLRRTPSYPTRREEKALGSLGPLLRPLPPTGGPPLFVPNMYFSTGASDGPVASQGSGEPPLSEYPEEYKVLAEEAHEALAAARKKMLERRGLGAPDLYWNAGDG
ncbi:gamma-tubulin complex component [Cyclospora cayetanensis]|uniref:Gamma-tubulin complex component n=1 Tax=Cyclospora cayetanensis TaxID=88456 RepID=A0A1D3D8I0_9EIME|nr:gamma-tubulin complex component [Cyclospora cayetanensis]